MWLLIFGGIAVVAVVVYTLLGRRLWRSAKALFVEVESALDRMELALADRDADDPYRDD